MVWLPLSDEIWRFECSPEQVFEAVERYFSEGVAVLEGLDSLSFNLTFG
jgi:hypothetical protein